MDYKNDKKISILTFTYYGTIIGDNFNEISVSDFFEKLEKNMGSDTYYVLYDKKNKVYFVTFDGEDYVLNLKKEVVEENAVGSYKEIIRKLKSLRKKQKLNNLENFFDDISSDSCAIDEYSKVYDLSYFIHDTVSSYYVDKLLKTLIVGFIAFLLLILNIGLFNLPSNLLGIFIYLMAGGTFSYFILPYIILISYFIISNFIGVTIVLFKNIFKQIKNKRLINKKIKELSSKNILDQIQIKTTTSIQSDELEKTTKIENKPSVIGVINDVSEKLAYINTNERKRLTKKLKKLLKEFKIRIKEIEKTSNNKISNKKDNNDKIKLETELLRKLYEIEAELLEIMKNSYANEQKIQSLAFTEQIQENVPLSLYTKEDTDLSTDGRAYAKKRN